MKFLLNKSAHTHNSGLPKCRKKVPAQIRSFCYAALRQAAKRSVRVGMGFLASELEREPFRRAADEAHSILADREAARGLRVGDFDFGAFDGRDDCAAFGDELVDQLVCGHIGGFWLFGKRQNKGTAGNPCQRSSPAFYSGICGAGWVARVLSLGDFVFIQEVG